MGRSLALSLYLFLAERSPMASAPERAPRPQGPLVWIHAGEGSRTESLQQLIRRTFRDRPDVAILLTETSPLDCGGFDDAGSLLRDGLPPENLSEIRAFLDHWRPEAALFVGSTLPPALIAETATTGIQLVLADIRMVGERIPFWRRGMVGSVLARFSRILAQDPETVDLLSKLGGRTLPVELGGRIEETTDPLPYLEPEREALAEMLRARPVWMAVACPEAEEEAVIAAHIHAMQHAHRLLLILSLANPERGPELARKLTNAGLIVAERAEDQDPRPEVQVLITDGATELGLWYRLAPVTFMGSTLLPGGAGRNPAEPAALGSAILHGPNAGAYPDAYAQLIAARATRPVASAEGLAGAVEDLIAPDKAAVLAHNAWAATSGGAEVAERVVQIMLSALDDPKSAKAVA